MIGSVARRATVLAALSLALAAAATASAAPNRIFVSGHGVDQIGCSAPTTPCRSLQFAHDHLAPGGEIDILDPAGYGAIEITKAISIVNDGVGTAGVQATSGIAINININATATVYLRGLNIDGVNATGGTGVQFNTGARLTMVDCVVRHFLNYGVALAPTGNETFFNLISSIVDDNTGGGVLVRPPSGGFTTHVVLDRMSIDNNGADGVHVDHGGAFADLEVNLSNDNISNNTGTGLKMAQTTASNAVTISVVRSDFYGNAYGINATGHGLIFLSDSSAFGNRVVDVNDILTNDGSSLYSFQNSYIASQGGSTPTHIAPY